MQIRHSRQMFLFLQTHLDNGYPIWFVDDTYVFLTAEYCVRVSDQKILVDRVYESGVHASLIAKNLVEDEPDIRKQELKMILMSYLLDATDDYITPHDQYWIKLSKKFKFDLID